jgi:hypothetical protein
MSKAQTREHFLSTVLITLRSKKHETHGMVAQLELLKAARSMRATVAQ